MTSWNWYIEHFLEKDHPLEWQKDILNQLKELEGKKMIGDTKFESEAIPCAVREMNDVSLEYGGHIRMPEFTLEVYPQTPEVAQKLFDYMQKGTNLNMRIERRGLFLEKDLNVARDFVMDFGKKYGLTSTLEPKRIVHSGPATIVFWNDKTKTVVKCSENDIYDEYEAFCAALAIKMFGSNSHLKKMIRDKTEERTPKKESEVKVKCEDSSLQEALNKIKRAIGVE